MTDKCNPDPQNQIKKIIATAAAHKISSPMETAADQVEVGTLDIERDNKDDVTPVYNPVRDDPNNWYETRRGR